MRLTRYILVLLTTPLLVNFASRTSLAFSLNSPQADINCNYYCSSISATKDGVGTVTTTLNPISQLPLGGTSDFLSLLKSSVWGSNGWTFNQATTSLSGGFNIGAYRPYAAFANSSNNNTNFVGADIQLLYNPSNSDPAGNQVHWI